jgi:NAD(P)-dependent dehydrogenase (short-subunit alcohol dehydrogenase family)
VTKSIVVGGSDGIGRRIAERLSQRGDEVIITSRSAERAGAVAAEIGNGTRGLALDLANPETIEGALADVAGVDNVVITAIAQFHNTLKDYNIAEAINSVTVKLVGYPETVRVLHERMNDGASVVLFGGLARFRPYPGSTMVTTFNGGISGLLRTLAVELAPHRVNVIHPGIVGDSPRWRDVPDHPAIPRTPLGRLVTMDEVAGAAEFLLSNTGVNAVELVVDGGSLVT